MIPRQQDNIGCLYGSINSHSLGRKRGLMYRSSCLLTNLLFFFTKVSRWICHPHLKKNIMWWTWFRKSEISKVLRLLPSSQHRWPQRKHFEFKIIFSPKQCTLDVPEWVKKHSLNKMKIGWSMTGQNPWLLQVLYIWKVYSQWF